jgi:hypothetical protein
MAFLGDIINISTDNFATLVRGDYLLVDKTLMIPEFFKGTTVSLVTRPRRFGKTLTLSMLQHFFAAEVNGIPTAGLFDQCVIAKEQDGEFLKRHQGQYPVIFISFKDLKEESYDSVIRKFMILTQELYQEHERHLGSDNISETEKTLFQQYLSCNVTIEQLKGALKFLSKFLSKVYNKKVFILIDEYDSPLTNAYQHTPKHLVSSEQGFLYRLSNFMRDLFSAALKTNPFLEKGLITGILRVSKNNMLSGLNNLKVYTILDEKYSSYFGFTQEEVNELIQEKMLTDNMAEIKSFYNGYLIGGSWMYNPWSFMSFLNKKELVPYWVMTSNDKILRDHFIGSDEDTKEKLKTLMLGETISGEINVNLQYEDLMQKPSALWTLLLFCGYLTLEAKHIDPVTLAWICELRVPNREINAQYRSIFQEWLSDHIGQSRYASLLSSLLKGDVPVFMQLLSEYLMSSLSFHDIVGKKSEKFYHGFVLGLIASIRDTHKVDSNKESGKGLCDVRIMPKDARYSVGVIIEFKHAGNETLLKESAEKAMQQIIAREYDTELKQSPLVKQVIKIGIAFCDKAVIATYITDQDANDILWSDTYLRDDDV